MGIIVQQRLAFCDPQDCTDNADTLALLDAVFDALIRRAPNGGHQPALAESWSVSSDARCWTFTLREGLRFHDGSPLDADAMAFSIHRMMRPDIGATLGAPAVWGQYLGGAKVVVENHRTLSVTTVEPMADLLDILVAGYAVPPHLVDQPGFLDQPIGSGAYRVERTDGADQITMTAHEGWYGGTLANSNLTWRRIVASDARAQMVASGTAHLAMRLNPADAAKQAGAGDFTTREYIDPTSIIYLLNAQAGVCADPRVRRALNLAVDRDALIGAVLGGAGRPLVGFISTAHSGHPGAAVSTGPDLAAARELLAEAGFADGLVLEVDCPTSLPDEAEALTAAMAAQLAKIGIELRVHLVTDRVAYAEQVRDKQIHDMCLFDSSPMSTFRVVYEKIDSRQRGSWWQGYANEEVEALSDRARVTTDEVERAGLQSQIYRLLQEDPAWLTLYNHLRTAVMAGQHSGWSMRYDGVLDVARLPKLG
jgi:peptide/nickel transport system substrate-binding protein